MIFTETGLAGAFLVDPEPKEDERGFFARLFCAESFAARGLTARFDQISLSHNFKRGTLRGLHLQRPPHAETKLVRVTAGAIFDVVVDVRAGSNTYGRWFATELDAQGCRQLCIPPGFVHGFQTLAEGTQVVYHISAPHAPEAQDGIRWDDEDLAIAWPLRNDLTLSPKDRGLKRLADFAPVDLACS